MDITLSDLNKMPIKRLKEVLKKLYKEPKNVETLTTIDIIKNIIRDKKKKGTFLHPMFIKSNTGFIREKKCSPIHLTQ